MDDPNGLKIPAAERDDDFKADQNAVTLPPAGERTSRVTETNVAQKSSRGPLDANAACRMPCRRTMATSPSGPILSAFERLPKYP